MIARRAVVASLVAACLFAACGSDAGTTSANAGSREPPATLQLRAVVAGTAGKGWVLGRTDGSPRDPADTLWLLDPDGTARASAALPRYDAVDAIGFGDGLAIAGLRCEGGDRCPRIVGSVQFLDERGHATSREFLLWKRSGPRQDGDGIVFVGVSASSVFVGVGAHVFEVGRNGAVLHDSPLSNGQTCVIGGQVYVVRDDTHVP